MASTIDTLSNSLQVERSESVKLLLENFEIIVRDKDLGCEIQRLLCSPNTKTPLSESKNIENRTNSVTAARRTTNPVTSNNIRAILHPLPNNELHPLQRNKYKDQVLALPRIQPGKGEEQRKINKQPVSLKHLGKIAQKRSHIWKTKSKY